MPKSMYKYVVDTNLVKQESFLYIMDINEF